MNKKLMLAGLIVLLVIGITFFVRNMEKGVGNTQIQNQESLGNSQANVGGNTNNFNDDEDEEEYEDDDDFPFNTQQPPASTQAGTTVSLTELAQHNTNTDCWVAFEGKVYDITSWLPVHPGTSAKIEPYCGTAEEFENAFTQMHKRSQVNRLMQVGTFMGDFDVVGGIG